MVVSGHEERDEFTPLEITKRFVIERLPEPDMGEMAEVSELLDRIMRERWAIMAAAFAAPGPPPAAYEIAWKEKDFSFRPLSVGDVYSVVGNVA